MAQKMREFTRQELKSCIEFSVHNSDEHTKLPICLWGYHGVGKTQLVGQIAEEIDYNLVTLHLSTQDMIDLIGRPITVETSGVEIQKWATPNWLYEAKENFEKTGKPNMFFLDEMNRAHQLVLNAMLPFLIEGKMHEHKIGPKDVVICACNPADGENYEVNEITDKAFLDRLGHVVVAPTSEEYQEYLEQIGMDPVTLAVVDVNPNFTKIPEIDPGFVPSPSRRSIVNVMQKVNAQEDNWIEKYGDAVIECYLGEEFKDKWLSTWHSTESVINLNMMMNWENNEEKIRKILFGKIDDNEVVRNDILDNCLELIKNRIVNRRGVSITDAKWIVGFLTMEGVPQDALAGLITTDKLMRKSIVEDQKVNSFLGEVAENLSLNPRPPFPMGVFK